MHTTTQQKALIQKLQTRPNGLLFESTLSQAERQVAMNLVKRGMVVRMVERKESGLAPEACFVVANDGVPAMLTETEKRRNEVIAMLNTAINDLRKNQRVDALDMIRMATRLIKDSMPGQEKRRYDEVFFSALQDVSKTINAQIKFAKESDRDFNTSGELVIQFEPDKDGPGWLYRIVGDLFVRFG